MYWALAPYVTISALYLACMRRESSLLRALKPLLMPSLLAGYLMLGDAQPLIALGLALGFAGDVALMLPRGRGLMAGMGAFMLGHLMYMAYFCGQLGGAPSPWTLAYALATAGVGVGLFAGYSEAASVVSARSVHAPNPQWQKVYREVYPIYAAIYDRIRPLNDRISNLKIGEE